MLRHSAAASMNVLKTVTPQSVPEQKVPIFQTSFCPLVLGDKKRRLQFTATTYDTEHEESTIADITIDI